MATITNAVAERIMIQLTITMNDGSVVTKNVPKYMINTPDKTTTYLNNLENPPVVTTPVVPPVDLSHLIGSQSSIQ